MKFQSFYSNMEALVFDEPRNELVDSTLPDVEAQDTKTEELIEQLTEEFGKVKNYIQY